MNPDLKTLEFVEDLIWYDGPLMTEYTIGEKHYLAVWVNIERDNTCPDDFTKNYSIWLLAEISKDVREEYLVTKKKTLRQVLEVSPLWKICGSFHDPLYYNTIKWDDVEDNIRPSEDSFYIEWLKSPYGKHHD